MFFRRRYRVVREVNAFKVGLHIERKVLHLGDLSAAKAVTPLVKSLRTVRDFQRWRAAWSYARHAAGGVFLVRSRHCHIINGKHKVIVNCLRGREIEREGNLLFFVSGVAKSIEARETNFVSAVPEQTFLSMLQIESDIDVAAFQRQRHAHLLVNLANNLLAILGALFGPGKVLSKESGWWRLVLRRSPGRDDAVFRK